MVIVYRNVLLRWDEGARCLRPHTLVNLCPDCMDARHDKPVRRKGARVHEPCDSCGAGGYECSPTTSGILKVCADLEVLPVEEHGRPWTTRRLYPGYWQRSEGAWSWVLDAGDHGVFDGQIGSQWPASVIIQKHRNDLVVADYCGDGGVALVVYADRDAAQRARIREDAP